MDVGKVLLGLICISTLSACADKKVSDVVQPLSAECAGRARQDKFIVHWEDGTFTVEHSTDIESFKREFVEPNLERIRKVEHDEVIQLDQGPPAGSTAFGSNSWGQDMVEAAAVWSQGVRGQGIVVGIVDSAVDVSHSQLFPRVAVNSGEIPGNGVDDDGNGYVDDVYGQSFISQPGANPTMNDHGSHVTGIVVADHSKGPIKGLAPHAKFVPAPFITNDGSGDLGDAILAMQYAASRGARVINASWGGPYCVTALRDAFLELARKDVLVIVAAGNEGRDIDYRPTYPAAFGTGNQLTVAAATTLDFMAYFSNTGFRLVHLAAPGVNIESTVPGNTTASMDGTSMAAPFVTGAAALLWSARPQATAAQVRSALLKSVDVTPYHEYRVSSRGRLNVRKAYQELLSLLP